MDRSCGLLSAALLLVAWVGWPAAVAAVDLGELAAPGACAEELRELRTGPIESEGAAADEDEAGGDEAAAADDDAGAAADTASETSSGAGAGSGPGPAGGTPSAAAGSDGSTGAGGFAGGAGAGGLAGAGGSSAGTGSGSIGGPRGSATTAGLPRVHLTPIQVAGGPGGAGGSATGAGPPPAPPLFTGPGACDQPGSGCQGAVLPAAPGNPTFADPTPGSGCNFPGCKP